MAAFDLQQYETALEKPEFISPTGKTYTGRILSIEEYLPFSARLAELAEGKLTTQDAITLYRDYLRAVFPRKVWFKWHGDPVDMIMKSPGLVPTMQHFFELQVTAIFPKPVTAN